MITKYDTVSIIIKFHFNLMQKLNPLKDVSYKQYDEKYSNIEKKIAKEGGYPCFYCGLKSESIDHFMPQAFMDNIRLFLDISDTDENIKNVVLGEQRLIPACKECNCLASDAVFNTPDQKKNYIKQKLLKRYQRILALPFWEENELNELSYILRTAVEGAIQLKELTIKRIRW